MTQKEFYHSMPWRRARAAYIHKREAIDGGLCEVCGEAAGKVVHHKIWLNDDNCNDPNISLNDANFRYECQTCHNKEEDEERRRRKYGRVVYLANGEVIVDQE